MPIRVLSPQEAARIAAGEVIERPASVVKELIENALDAGATDVTVETRQGGTTFLRVTDNGCGIEPDELCIAFERHATSKVSSEDELWRIGTLGFRGEALPSIAAAADVEFVSRPAEALVGGRLVLRDGLVDHQGSAGAPPGTSITVQNLFRRQPARLKFLRSAPAEGTQIAAVVSHYALAYPEVRFTLRAENRVVLQTTGSGDLRDAAAAVHGLEIAAGLLEMSSGTEGPIAISGLTGSPAISRANRNYISLFVNRRWIRNRSLTYAVVEAYQGMLPLGRFPVAIVDIRVPADAVDVNVHPTKAEVRFREERAVFAVLQRTVRSTLAERASVPQFQASSSVFEAKHAEAQQRAMAWREQATQHRMVPQPGAPAPGPHIQAPGSGDQLPIADSLPLLRPVGQLGNTYVVAEGPDGMYMIDQHAAHERVLYERYRKEQRDGTRDVQPLLQPQTLDLTAKQRTLLESFREELDSSGLAVEPFGEGAYLVRAVPPSLAGKDIVRAIGELLDLIGREDSPTEDPAHRVAASLACHASVRAGQTMPDEEQRELLRLLEEAEHPRTCPHGRPTMIHLSSDTLAKQFRRR